MKKVFLESLGYNAIGFIFNDNDDGCFLYHSFRKLKDFEGLAWAKLPAPHKQEDENENAK